MLVKLEYPIPITHLSMPTALGLISTACTCIKGSQAVPKTRQLYQRLASHVERNVLKSDHVKVLGGFAVSKTIVVCQQVEGMTDWIICSGVGCMSGPVLSGIDIFATYRKWRKLFVS